MASVTENRPPEPTPLDAPPSEQRYVDEQIRRTRRALKLVDLTAGMLTLVVGVLLYLLMAAVLEHWVVPGGWSPTARATLLIVLLGGVGWYGWRMFWPLVSKPINPAFAAQAIEKSSPSLKNSLLNLLLLRESRRQISRQVYQAIERQAAQRLSEVPVDSVVDRGAVLRLGYVLAAVVGVVRALSNAVSQESHRIGGTPADALVRTSRCPAASRFSTCSPAIPRPPAASSSPFRPRSAAWPRTSR